MRLCLLTRIKREDNKGGFFVSVKKGSVVEGKVKSIAKFGAFVELPTGAVGLVYISEIANEYIDDIRKYLKEQQTVRVKVLDIKENGKKIHLSIKKANEVEKSKRPLEKKNKDTDFEARLSKFLKDSNQKQNEYNKRFGGKKR